MAQASQTLALNKDAADPDPPPCVGTYDPNHAICNGNPSGKTEYDRRPCRWRDRCVGLQAYAAEYKLDPVAIVEGQDKNSLAVMCDEQIVFYGVKDGKVAALEENETPPPMPPPIADPDVDAEPESGDVLEVEGDDAKHAPAPRKKRKSPRRRSPPRSRSRPKGSKPARSRYSVPLNDKVLELGAHFERQIKKRFKNHRVRPQRSKRVLARPGTIYAIDRTETSRYVSWYCLQDKGRDQAIACVRFKPALIRLDIEIPAEISDLRSVLSPAEFKRIRARPLSDGQFRAMCTHLDHEGVGLVAEALARLADDGRIKLSQGV